MLAEVVVGLRVFGMIMVVKANGFMAELVTLELSDEVAHRAREAARESGRRVEDVLAGWLERAAGNDLGLPATEYSLLTPYGNEDAAQTLLDVLRAAESRP